MRLNGYRGCVCAHLCLVCIKVVDPFRRRRNHSPVLNIFDLALNKRVYGLETEVVCKTECLDECRVAVQCYNLYIFHFMNIGL